ncbi:OmpP1/FadL family transporter [Polluticoccus soli]|uniref:OmpP1/FadL family transporter n=1 Tax=Polluticoccus soli TaxID=3034150 RepID=UPI0023E252F0|nr:outer membrane protein transport protein [Flavipsychrobacter sp. JY13-12]
MKKHVLIATTLALSSAMSYGAGYQLNLQGLRQIAMGGSGTAVPWDMSTIFYNPGGMTAMDHWQIYAGAAFVTPHTKYVESTGTYEAETQSQTFVPFSIYAGGPTSWRSPVSIGVGIYTPFGNGVKWDDNWRGRYVSQEANLHTVFIQPTVSYKFSEVVSAGIGLIYATGRMELRRAVPIADENNVDSRVELAGNGHGFGFNAGVHINASEKVQVGFNFRSKVNMDVDRGYASFTVPQSLQTAFPYTAFSSSLPMPMVTSLGVGYAVNECLTLQGDINIVGWSAFDNLDINYENNTPQLQDQSSVRNYRNTVSVRVGGHYTVSDRVAVMAGAAYDPTPVRDGYVTPELPDANRGILSAGLTYKPFERWTVMGALEFASSVNRQSSFDEGGFSGRYKTNAFVPAIGASFDF